MLCRVVFYLVVALFCMYVAVIPAGRRRFAEQIPTGWVMGYVPVSRALPAFALLFAAVVAVAVAFQYLKKAVDRKPMLVINSKEFRHNTLSGDPCIIRWEDVDMVKVQKHAHHGFHTSYHIALIPGNCGRKNPPLRDGAAFAIGDIDESENNISCSIRSHAPSEVKVEVEYH